MIEAVTFLGRTYGFGPLTVVTGGNGAGKSRALRAIADYVAKKKSTDPIEVVGSVEKFGFAPVDLPRNTLRSELLRRFGPAGVEAKSQRIEDAQLEISRIGREIGAAERAAEKAKAIVAADTKAVDPVVLPGLRKALLESQAEYRRAVDLEKLAKKGKCPLCGSTPKKADPPKVPSRELASEIAAVERRIREIEAATAAPPPSIDVAAERARQEELKIEVTELKAEIDGAYEIVKTNAIKALKPWLPKSISVDIDLAAGTWLLGLDSTPVALSIAPTSARSTFAVGLACAFGAPGVAVIDDYSLVGMQRPLIKSVLKKLELRVADGSIEQAIVVVRPEDLEIVGEKWVIVEVVRD